MKKKQVKIYRKEARKFYDEKNLSALEEAVDRINIQRNIIIMSFGLNVVLAVLLVVMWR